MTASFNYLLFTILHKYSIVQNFKEPMKATKAAVDIVSKNPPGNVSVKFSVKLLPANMGFVNCFGLKFSQILRTHRSRICEKVFCEKMCS